MFVESCPGGTVWDDLNKACVWPDMQGVVSTSFSDQSQQQGLFQFFFNIEIKLIYYFQFMVNKHTVNKYTVNNHTVNNAQ
jgi:hypothetical protein